MKTFTLLFASLIFLMVGATANSQSLNYIESDAMGPLNPYAEISIRSNAERFYSLIYEGLLRYDHNQLEYRPVLARGIDELSGNRVRVQLRNNVRWHDGERFTARDVEFTYNYIRDKAASATIRNWYNSALNDINVIDDYTVEFTLNNDVSDYRQFLDAWIIPNHMFDADTMEPVSQEKNLARQPIGTGLFKFENRNIRGAISTVKNEQHYVSNPFLTNVDMQRTPDLDTRITMLRVESTDLLIDLPPARIAEIEATENIRLEPYQSYSIITMGFNLERNFLQDQRLRHAIIYGTNRQQMLDQWYAGRGELLAGPFTEDAPNFDPELTPFEYNRSYARQLLEEAGYNNIELDLLVRRVDDAGERALQNVTQDFVEMMEEIGIRINVVNRVQDDRDQDLYYDRNFDLALVQWTFDPTYDIAPLFHSDFVFEGGTNVVSYRNEEVDSLFERFFRTDDSTRRTLLMNNIQAIIAEDAPYMFMFSVDNHAAINTRFVNTIIDPFYFFSDIEEWQTIY